MDIVGGIELVTKVIKYHHYIGIRVETKSGHLGHILSRSSGSYLLYRISGSDPD